MSALDAVDTMCVALSKAGVLPYFSIFISQAHRFLLQLFCGYG